MLHFPAADPCGCGPARRLPAGVPVGTLAIGAAGAANAGLLAAQILALSDHALATRVMAWRAAQTDGVAEAPEDNA